MKKSIFDISDNDRVEEQEGLKAGYGLPTKNTMARLNITLPPEYKNRFNNYCEKHYITPSAQIRAWIDEFCK